MCRTTSYGRANTATAAGSWRRRIARARATPTSPTAGHSRRHGRSPTTPRWTAGREAALLKSRAPSGGTITKQSGGCAAEGREEASRRPGGLVPHRHDPQQPASPLRGQAAALPAVHRCGPRLVALHGAGRPPLPRPGRRTAGDTRPRRRPVPGRGGQVLRRGDPDRGRRRHLRPHRPAPLLRRAARGPPSAWRPSASRSRRPPTRPRLQRQLAVARPGRLRPCLGRHRLLGHAPRRHARQRQRLERFSCTPGHPSSAYGCLKPGELYVAGPVALTSRTDDFHTDATGPFPDVCCSWNTRTARNPSRSGHPHPG